MRCFVVGFVLSAIGFGLSVPVTSVLAASSSTPATLIASTSTVATTSVDPVARFLRMYDGRWYDPTSGFVAATREELLNDLSRGGASLVPQIVAATGTLPIPSAVTTTTAVFPLRLALERAYDLLSSTSSRPTKAGALVALWNPVNDQIRLSFVASAKRLNVASVPAVKKQDGEIVVGVRFALPPKTAVTKSKKSKKVKAVPLEDLIYLPDNDALHTTEVIAYGKDTLERFSSEAFSSLQRAPVPSRAVPGKTVADVINPNLLKSLVMIEHLDRASLIKHPTDALERIYVTLAANQERAFAHVKSPAGALGLAQFMPKTYARLANDPATGLLKDFERGMRDPINAMRAQAIFLDRVLAELPSDVRGLLDERQTEMEEYLAAAYNGGGARVSKAVKARGESWDAGAATEIIKLQKQQTVLENEQARLKRKLKQAKTAKTKKALKGEIGVAGNSLAKIKTQLAQAKASSLRTETVQYLTKYRIVAPLLRTENMTASLVTTTNPGI